MNDLIFSDFKARASSLGHLMTCLPKPITTDEIARKAELENEKESGVNANGRKTKWTDTKQKDLDSLIKKEKGVDELPTGAITHLEDIFRSQFWGRKRILTNKYIDKGLYSEEDSLELLSDVDGEFYKKNDEHFTNDFLQGTPDYCDEEIVIDTKTSWDMDTFDKAEMTSLYEWQIKAYLILTGTKKGILAYCLVNNPGFQIINAKNSLYYAMGQPDYNSERWIEAVSQLEKNSIFDLGKFREQEPNFELLSGGLGFYVPPTFRVKKFQVALEPNDEALIKSRVEMARKWLCDKETEIMKQLKNLEK